MEGQPLTDWLHDLIGILFWLSSRPRPISFLFHCEPKLLSRKERTDLITQIYIYINYMEATTEPILLYLYNLNR